MPDKKILIAVPTYRRAAIVKYLLEKIGDTVNAYPNLFLGIYDSSDDDDTEANVRPYLSDKIHYKRYEAGVSEEKVYDVFLSEGSEYDYIWFCSDRKVLKLEALLPMIEPSVRDGVDLILLSDLNIRDASRTITDAFEIGDMYFEIANQAKTIIGKSMFAFMADRDRFWNYIGSGLSRQALIVDYCGRYPFRAVQYNLRDQDIAETGSVPFVHEWSRVAVWQWSESWCGTVDKLPEKYDPVRERIAQTNKMFSFRKIVARRATGTEFPIADIKKYRKHIRRMNPNMAAVYLAILIPRPLLIVPYKLYKRIKSAT